MKNKSSLQMGNVKKSATFSPCRKYRYSLWRTWFDLMEKPRGCVMFIGLNPSTADGKNDDPTIRRCIAYARAWGYGGLCMTNLFAFRATDPNDMMKAREPVGPENDEALIKLAKEAEIVIAAWGVRGSHRGRGDVVSMLLPRLHYLRLTKDGFPEHPLYLPKTLTPIEWPMF